MKNNEYMKVAVEEANINMKENFVNGGPFGAVIVKEGKIISRWESTKGYNALCGLLCKRLGISSKG